MIDPPIQRRMGQAKSDWKVARNNDPRTPDLALGIVQSRVQSKGTIKAKVDEGVAEQVRPNLA